MALDWSNMIGNLLGGMGQSLGYGNMAIQRKPNGPPTKKLLPSQQAMTDLEMGIAHGQAEPLGQYGGAVPLGGYGIGKRRMMDTPAGVSFHKYGGRLDRNAVNVFAEGTPYEEALVGEEVVPTGPDSTHPMAPDVRQLIDQAVQPNRRMGMIDEQLGTTGGHTPEDYGLAQTEDTPWSAQTPTANTADSIPSARGMLSPQGSPANPSGEPMPDPNSEEGIRQQYDETLKMRAKRSPWADLGVSLVQAGDNWFNHKNEPIKTWAELKTDRKLNSLGQRLGLAKDVTATKTAAEQKAAQIARLGAQGTYDLARAEKMYADIESQRKKDALVGKEWKPLKAENKIFKQYPDGRVEPLLDPETNEQMRDEERVTVGLPGSQGRSVSVNPRDALTNATALETTNTGRVQDMTKFNASQGLEAQKTNVANSMKFADDTRAVLIEIAKANAAIFAGNPAVQASATNIQGLADQTRQLSDQYAQAVEKGDTALATSLQESLWTAQANIAKEQESLAKAMGQIQGGEMLAKQLRSAMPKAPAKVTYTPQAASTINRSEKVVDTSGLDAFAKAKGWTRQQAEQYAKKNGWTIK